MKNNNLKIGVLLAIWAAVLYAVSIPVSKLLLVKVPSTLMAGFLYLGAGIGMLLISMCKKLQKKDHIEQKLSKQEIPYVIAMIVLDIAAPIFLLIGLKTSSAESVSLLNNFEIVITAVIALIFFKEIISPRLWMGIVFVSLSCLILSIEDVQSFKFSIGSIFVLIATLCWGIENNCTRKISSKDPLQIVLLKGIFSGLGSLVIGLCLGERIVSIWVIFAVLGLGFISYGLSIFAYVYAQRFIGAARTSAFYAISPFVGVLLSLIIFQNELTASFFIALIFMAFGAFLASNDKPIFKRKIKFCNKWLNFML